ncbi:major facilitator superfamily domain-containing protein [Lineolata rhizophorae]|uniref:Major facilitator superfamily domain-containing protein n=1 Tax=Lineolata rhizophorae TaxID=578093 RepID=A0A6A6NLQ3_9PEZI|nr:major facilitator superfamily domain-containing protein [Lineolata rhizophorae]
MVTLDRKTSGGSYPDLEKTDIKHQELYEGSVREDAEDPIEAKKVIRKIDIRLLPLLVFLYTLTFLDRVNIGNARLWGMEDDLGMTGYHYNIVVMVFYIPYVLLEIPSNMIINRIKPRYWISGLTMGWGLSVTFAGFSTSFGGLLTARIFIGIFEAGMFPGCLFLISSWYRRHEVLTRMALFMVSNDIAGSVSGLLGAGLGSMDGIKGYSGWSWIFFVEGGVTCAAAILAFFCVLPFPEESKFLSLDEKEWLLRRLKADDYRNKEREKITLKGVFRALADWRIICTGVMYLAVCVTAYSITIFQPTILSGFGWDSLKSNLLTAPVRIVSGIVSVAMAFWSDKVKRRGIFCLSGYTISIMGSLIVMLHPNNNVRYMGLYFAAIGIYIVQPLCIAWGSNQVVGYTKRGTLTAFAISSGQIGGIISALVFPKQDGPRYYPGISTCIAFAFVGIIAGSCMWGFGAYENRMRDAGKREHLRNLPPENLEGKGEKHPDFRYTV